MSRTSHFNLQSLRRLRLVRGCYVIERIELARDEVE